MRKTVLMSLLIIAGFISFSISAFADETTATEKTEKKTDENKAEPKTEGLQTSEGASKVEPAMPQTVTAKLEQKPGLPELTMPSMVSMFCRSKTDVVKTMYNINLVLPEKLINPVIGRIFYNKKTHYFVISREKEGRNYTQLYFDKNADKNLKDETAVKSTMNYRRPGGTYEHAYFEMVEIPVGETKVGVLMRYTLSEYVQQGTKKKIRNEYFQYTIVQQFTGKFKIADKEYSFAIIDQKADGKLDFGSKDLELWFIDVNGDGKYEFLYNGPEILSSTEFMVGKYAIVAKFDIQKMQAEFTISKPVFGKIKLGIEGAKDAYLYIAKSASHWGQQYKVEFKDGIGEAPVGKLMLRQLEFTKNGKHNKLFYRSYTRKDKIEVSIDKPYVLKLDLLFRVNGYGRGTENGKQKYMIMGYVFDRRKYKGEDQFTRIQLYQNDKEVPPCNFIIKDSKENEVSKGVGYFC